MKYKYLLPFFYLVAFNSSAIGWFGSSLNNTACKGNSQGHGPFDYLEILAAPDSALSSNARLWEVDKIHLGKGMNILRTRGLTVKSNKLIKGEYDYTLRVFPNHSKALYAVIQLEFKRLGHNIRNSVKLLAPLTPPECYLNRAIAFRPNQADLYLLYGIYLQKLKHYEIAKGYYIKALSFAPYNPEVHYNYGLLLFRMNDFDNAKKHALKASELKHPLSGLKYLLESKGHW